jgi:hypothetical protein
MATRPCRLISVLLKWIFEMNGISNQMKFHPFADIFPLLEGEQFEEFVQDIKARGLVSRIVLYEDAILDGRNRYKACLEARIEPRYEQYNGRDPLAHVISLNMKRRHLDESQRAMRRLGLLRLVTGNVRSAN